MAEKFPLYGYTNPWAQHVECRDTISQAFMAAMPAQQMIYHNMHMQGLQQTLGRYMTYHHPTLQMATKMTHSVGNSTTSSPLSTISCEESPDSVNVHDAAERLHKSVSPPAIGRQHCHSKIVHSAQSFDTPIDLSKPKQSPNFPKKCSSQLSQLLSRKRSCESDNRSHEQLGPLNLSKKVCSARLPSTVAKVVDMKDAVDNPVQLVQLLNEAMVTEQVTQFLNQMIHRIFTLEQFHTIEEDDKISLVMNCWHRLILWIFAENKFTFQVTSLSSNSQKLGTDAAAGQQQIQPPRLNQPTMAFVRSIATFIKKYKSLGVDSEELRLLFAITLFHSTGDESFGDGEKIVEHRKTLMSQLHTYVMSNGGGGPKRYSDLLLYLPMLYGVNGKMVEELFCQHISPNVDIKTILTKTVRNLSLRD